MGDEGLHVGSLDVTGEEQGDEEGSREAGPAGLHTGVCQDGIAPV